MRCSSNTKMFALFSIMLAFATGCGKVDRDYSVKIIVPDEYVGLIRVIFDSNGAKVPIFDGQQVFAIPPGGVLRVQGKNPFAKFGSTSVESASGDPILMASYQIANDVPPNPHDRLFRIVGSPSNGEEMWAVVGTEADEHAARLKLHDYESASNRDDE